MERKFDPIRILEIISDEVGEPRNDGTRGSGLYEVPFRLSNIPAPEWEDFFIESWNLPPSFSSMHRPGIASVLGDKIILDGTTLEEVEEHHKETLLLAVREANRKYSELLVRREREEQQKADRVQKHREVVQEKAKRIKFDE
jgi:hypothetical protein